MRDDGRLGHPLSVQPSPELACEVAHLGAHAVPGKLEVRA